MNNKSETTPNMKDIALKAEVSTATVSHVINGTRFVSEEVTARVRTAMDELGYYPNLLARSLRSQSSKTIGLIIPDISNFYYTGMAEGVESTLKKNGYHMILSNSYDDVSNEIEAIKLYNSLQIDGVIMVPAIGSQSYLDKYLKGKYPVVFADRRPHGFTGDYVILENVKSTYEAISLLIRKGHTKIGFAGGDSVLSTTYDRILGYKNALKDHGIGVEDALIKTGSFTYDSGREIAPQLIHEHNVSAIFFANEMMTIGAVSYIRQHGIKIPEEVAVISCNCFKWTEITAPPLTVVDQPSARLGNSAAELLLSRINNEAAQSNPIELSLETSIIVRESC